MSSSSDDSEELILQSKQPEIKTEAQNDNDSVDSLLPSKSKEKYMLAYQRFIHWTNSKNMQSLSENVFMAYFNELSKKYKPSSLWCIYSMLKSTVRTKNGIEIKTFSNLTTFLKRCSDGFISKKSISKVLLPNDIEIFLKEAPDNRYLATKVALIFGITGACRRQELINITTKDIENHGQILLVKLTNTKKPRSFIIDSPFYEIVKKYESLRSTKAKTDRFFQNFQNGKCTSQPIGVNKFGSMPKEIAKFLGLPEAASYTGHSFRRTSATLLADSGADILTLKRHGGWRSNTVAESYVEDSIQNKTNISAKITQTINLEPQSKKFCPEPCPSTSNTNNDLKEDNDDNDNNDNLMTFTNDTSQGPSTSYSYENDPLSPTFTVTQDQNNEIVNNIITQTVQMPAKPIAYHFHNCTFNHSFNNKNFDFPNKSQPNNHNLP